MHNKSWMLAAVVAALLSGQSLASEKDEATKMVASAVAAASKDKAAALADMKNPKGPYVKGEVYVFAYDMSGTTVAHPLNAGLIGKNMLDVPDANGKLFRREIMDGIKSSGAATVEYKYKNPQSNKVEDKVTTCRKAADLAICAGYYK